MNNEAIKQIRAFDRFYTRIFRLTDKYHLHTNLTLLEARILLEIGEHHRDTASLLIQELTVDKGYLSRVLKRLEEQDLLGQTPDPTDKRTKRLSLTEAGQEQLALLNQRADDQVTTLFAGLSAEETERVLDAMSYVEKHVQLGDD
ncbi:MarR family winged helix-turn-helix transcriptional regulator [Levilactobacillus cerevisiae]|uniref:MarR family winged helix-turn-helix transcriptional regulator n=1 Tax=Levilactobacillus cerevisiae TaxID=1704076 RepID=UPI0013DDDD8B|nr:winged helix DNA-binding protein [Levilactobacillus cerevisiae]